MGRVEVSPDLDISKKFENDKPEENEKALHEMADKPTPGEVEEKKQSSAKSNKNFMLIAIVLVAVAGGLYLYNPFSGGGTSSDQVTYNGFQFVKIDTHWNTQWQGGEDLYILRLRFNPYEAENVPVFGELGDNFSLITSYVTFDPDKEENTYGFEALTAAELSLNLAGVFGTDLIAACTKNVSGECSRRPTITCDNTNETVIYIKRSEGDPEVLLEGNCVTISGNGFDLVKAADKLLYKIYDIIE